MEKEPVGHFAGKTQEIIIQPIMSIIVVENAVTLGKYLCITINPFFLKKHWLLYTKTILIEYYLWLY